MKFSSFLESKFTKGSFTNHVASKGEGGCENDHVCPRRGEGGSPKVHVSHLALDCIHIKIQEEMFCTYYFIFPFS